MTILPTEYRPCVGMMVLNRDNHVLVGKRIDSSTEAWQMPQGGIDEGEDGRAAALRELEEEIGTSDVTFIAESHDWLHYDLPEALIPNLWGGRYRGQKQRWFLMRLNEDTACINIHTKHAEFCDVKWISPTLLPEVIVPFKQQLYRDVLAEFSSHL